MLLFCPRIRTQTHEYKKRRKNNQAQRRKAQKANYGAEKSYRMMNNDPSSFLSPHNVQVRVRKGFVSWCLQWNGSASSGAAIACIVGGVARTNHASKRASRTCEVVSALQTRVCRFCAHVDVHMYVCKFKHMCACVCKYFVYDVHVYMYIHIICTYVFIFMLPLSSSTLPYLYMKIPTKTDFLGPEEKRQTLSNFRDLTFPISSFPSFWT